MTIMMTSINIEFYNIPVTALTLICNIVTKLDSHILGMSHTSHSHSVDHNLCLLSDLSICSFLMDYFLCKLCDHYSCLHDSLSIAISSHPNQKFFEKCLFCFQGPEHPNPGKSFSARGFPRHCYLPDSEKGRKVRPRVSG